MEALIDMKNMFNRKRKDQRKIEKCRKRIIKLTLKIDLLYEKLQQSLDNRYEPEILWDYLFNTYPESEYSEYIKSRLYGEK